MQERLEKMIIGVRWGVIAAIGGATLAAALFSGCNSDFSNKNKPKSNDEKNEKYSDPRLVKDNVEHLEKGPLLFDPRVNMGMPSSESIYAELHSTSESVRSYKAPTSAPLQTTPVYQNLLKPVAVSQPLELIQKPKADDNQHRLTNQANQSSEYQTPASSQQTQGYQGNWNTQE